MPRFRAMFAALAAVLCAAPAVGGPGKGVIFEAAGLVPGDVDVLVVVDDAAKIRRGQAGGAWGAIARTGLDLTETLRAWKDLARALDLPQDKAFDELLGHRVIVCLREMDDDQDDDPAAERPRKRLGPTYAWAALMLVERGAAARLQRRLKIAPREIVAGLPVLSVEGGAFELAIKPDRGRRGAVVVMAPAGATGLLDSVAAVLSGQDERPLIKNRAYAQFIDRLNGRPGTGLAFARLDRFDGWAGLIADVDGRTLRLREYAHLGENAPWPTPSSTEPWRRLGDGSLAWFVELSPKEMPQAEGLLQFEIGDVLNLPEDLEETLGERLAFCMRQAPDGGLALAAAAATDSVDRLAPILDRLIARLGARALAAFGESPAPGDLDFGGLFPEAARAQALIKPGDAGPRAPLWPLFGGDLTLRWTYQRTGGDVQDPGRQADAGWAILATEPALLEDAIAAAKEDRRAEPERRWLSFAQIHPGAIMDLLRDRGVPAFGPFEIARWLDRVSWSSWTPEPGAIEGRVEVTFADQPGE